MSSSRSGSCQVRLQKAWMYSSYRKSILCTVPGSSFSSSSVLPSSMSKSVPRTLLSPLFRGTTGNKKRKH